MAQLCSKEAAGQRMVSESADVLSWPCPTSHIRPERGALRQFSPFSPIPDDFEAPASFWPHGSNILVEGPGSAADGSRALYGL